MQVYRAFVDLFPQLTKLLDSEAQEALGPIFFKKITGLAENYCNHQDTLEVVTEWKPLY